MSIPASATPFAWVLDPISSPGHDTPTRVAVAAARAGAVPLLRVGPDSDVAGLIQASTIVRSKTGRVPGLFIEDSNRLDLGDVERLAAFVEPMGPVLLGAGHASRPDLAELIEQWAPTQVSVEVTSLGEAVAAARSGACEIVVKGNEAGGRVGATSTYVLLQQTLANAEVSVPIRARGGIGVHTAAAAVTAGAAGVVLDDQLALAREVELPDDLSAAIRAMDGSETTVVGHHRIFTRPDLPAATLDIDADPHEVQPRLGTDLAGGLVPMGQDASFARALADRYVTIGGIVQALTAAAFGNVVLAATQSILGPDGAFARAHHLEVPVAQGPMTRVSDRAGFAAKVADGGGLPFLALSLLRGPEVRTLLEETATLLGDRPWGVGILGFVPPELRDEQLAVVRELKPPVALIAGGRPSQAAPLEADGMATFLHVPSPGLLDRFLADGARRFVFEGRECGGHIGPRSSFVLWESQVERLLSFADRIGGSRDQSLVDVHVLLAGGIHDERSAAMAAAVAAPLAERGASVGVLMGTAYLFTDAAVSEGAIQPCFQEVAIACDDTALLRTAPGHAIRCAHTPFVDTFAAAERELVDQGLPRDERWLKLEELNLGRLRVAAKGVDRIDGELQPVTHDQQRSEGMFMLGDVASLRACTTTIAELHAQVSSGANAWLADAAARQGDEASGENEDVADPLEIAIVGMATVLPGAANVAQFWANIVNGVDSISEVPAERWEADRWHASGPDAKPGITTPSRWGGFVPEIAFDALAYGIPPRSLASIETVQLLALHVAAEALADAGYKTRPFDRERTSVIFGAEAGTDLSSAYGLRASFRTYLGELPAELDEHLPSLTEDSFPGMLTNVIAGRIANRLDLGGSNFTVDAACASSLAALDLACKELRLGTSDMVLCGGADLHNGIHDFLLFSSVHALSPGGRCRTFDAEADGIALGEGVACVALKRLADAERDGDHIHGVIRAVAGSSDGRHLGLTAPRPEGQERALRRAYARAGISPSQVELIEAHGTGTAVGDRTELSTLRDVFEESGATPRRCTVGSVKSNIGHTKCAAGLAGLVKATLAVEHGILPPTLHVRTPNPAHDPESGPFAIYSEARPWLTERRIAGVSAFGFGGTNFHAIVERYTGDAQPRQALDRWPAELLLFRGSEAEVAATIEALRTRIAAAPVELRDLAATVAQRGRGEVRVAVVADSVEDLASLFDAMTEGRSVENRVIHAAASSPDEPGRLAFVFSGQGSQRPSMLADLFVTFPHLRRHLEPGSHLVDTIFPPNVFEADQRAAQRDALTDTAVAQPALGMVELALAELLEQCGITPDLAAGHSYGEVAALAAAGAIPPSSLLATSEARAAAILEAAGGDPGAMAAVSASADDVTAVLNALALPVVVANQNSPLQSVISGATEAVAAAVDGLREKGFSVKELPVACAFHSPVVAAGSEAFGRWLAGLELAEPRYEVWSNTTAAPHTLGSLADTLASQIAEPVRWVDQIVAMWEAGARTFVEVGPGRVLSGLVTKILGDRPHQTIACDIPGENGVRQFLVALAHLAASGHPVDLTSLLRERAQPLDLRQAPARPGWTIDGHLVRTADGQPVPGGLLPVTERPIVSLSPSLPVDSREDVVHRYLDGMAEMVAAQRDVMLAMLGADPSVSTPRPARVIDTAARSAPAAVPLETGPVGTAKADTPTIDLSPEGLLDLVLNLVGDRTGYPLDMLDPGLDLEADLSIDSIKRIEIIGELFDRLPGGPASADEVSDEVVEQLAGIKTISGIVAWILEQPDIATVASTPSDSTATGSATTGSGTATAGPSTIELPPRSETFTVGWTARQTVRAGEHGTLLRTPVTVRGSHPLAGPLIAAIEAATATTVTHIATGSDCTVDIDALADAPPAATFIDLTALTEPTSPVDLLALVQHLAASDVQRVMIVHPHVGAEITNAGIPGMIRTAARERPSTVWQSLAWADDDEPTVDRVMDELLATNPDTTVRYRSGQREVPELTSNGLVDLTILDDTTPSGEGLVAVLTGGAQGITARVAEGLASRGWRVELLGRSPLPGAEPDRTAGADTPTDIRRAIIDAGSRDPRAIEAEVSATLKDRRIRATLARLASQPGGHSYHAIDVRDAHQVTQALKQILTDHGHIDLVIHGAGVLEDRFLADKDPDSFQRVFETKVAGLQALLDATADQGCRTIVFGSIAGVFGNLGQVDYAAANDALDSAAHLHDRVVALDWGPWAGGGMVDAGLEREYERRGIGLVDPDDGMAAVLDAIASANPSAQTVVMRADLSAFSPEPTASR